MRRTLRDAEASLSRGQAAAQSGLLELLHARESKILVDLVARHQSGKLADRDAAIGIAVLSEIRSTIRSITRAINEGIDAGASLTQRSNRP